MIGAGNLERRFRVRFLPPVALPLIPPSHPPAAVSSFSPRANVLLGKISQYTTCARNRRSPFRALTNTRSPFCHRRLLTTLAPRGLTFCVTVVSTGTDRSRRESSTCTAQALRFSVRPLGTRICHSAPRHSEFSGHRAATQSMKSCKMWKVKHCQKLYRQDIGCLAATLRGRTFRAKEHLSPKAAPE